MLLYIYLFSKIVNFLKLKSPLATWQSPVFSDFEGVSRETTGKILIDNAPLFRGKMAKGDQWEGGEGVVGAVDTRKG